MDGVLSPFALSCLFIPGGVSQRSLFTTVSFRGSTGRNSVVIILGINGP